MQRCFHALKLCLWLVWISQASAIAKPALEAVTFAMEPGAVYVPLNEAAERLRLEVQRDENGRCTRFDNVIVPTGSLRCLIDGTELVRTSDLQFAGAEISCDAENRLTVIRRGFHQLVLATSPQRVEINLAEQQLRAWQGARLVLQTRISSGRNGRTPAGSFTAGPFRARMHYSCRYQRAPMPWSVQISGNVFIHGFASVPNYPASHGCIRLPLDGGNPARFFYEWVANGTPVQVVLR